MTEIINFTKPYNPSAEAAMFDLANAEYECEAINRLPCYGDDRFHQAERFRAARERLHAAQSIARIARLRETDKRRGVWF